MVSGNFGLLISLGNFLFGQTICIPVYFSGLLIAGKPGFRVRRKLNTEAA